MRNVYENYSNTELFIEYTKWFNIDSLKVKIIESELEYRTTHKEEFYNEIESENINIIN